MIESNRNLNKQIYNIGPDNNEITINHLAEYISILTDLSPELIFIPDRPREVKNAYCSSDKIKKEFNYNANINITTTLSNMIEWVNKRGSRDFDYHLPIEITNIDNSYTITVIDLEDNEQHDLRAIDIIKFDKYNIIKKNLLNSIK